MYFDNGATTYPKPEVVLDKIYETMKYKGGNSGRGMSSMSLDINRYIYNTRSIIAGLINAKNPMDISFTKNCTEALNFGIQGILKKGDHVITTSMEHNSVLRPLYELKEKGLIQLDIVWADEQGLVEPNDFIAYIKDNTKLIISTHMSNLTGTIIDIGSIGQIARANEIIFMVDGAQSIGLIPIDVEEMNIDILAFPGHKNLLGPQGTGGLYVGPDVELEPILYGGTGSYSEDLNQPKTRPDRYEAGTLNGPGIVGLYYGIESIMENGMEKSYIDLKEKTRIFSEGIKPIEGVSIYGPIDFDKKGPIVSFNVEGINNEDLGFILDRDYNIITRTGYHCAPLAHRTIGTGDTGCIRFSFGNFNTISEILESIEILKKIIEEFKTQIF